MPLFLIDFHENDFKNSLTLYTFLRASNILSGWMADSTKIIEMTSTDSAGISLVKTSHVMSQWKAWHLSVLYSSFSCKTKLISIRLWVTRNLCHRQYIIDSRNNLKLLDWERKYHIESDWHDILLRPSKLGLFSLLTVSQLIRCNLDFSDIY